MRKRNSLSRALILTLFVSIWPSSLATHFMGGIISARPLGSLGFLGGPISSFGQATARIGLRVRLAWRSTFDEDTMCSSADVATGKLIGPSGGERGEIFCEPNCTQFVRNILNATDTSSIKLPCVAYSTLNRWSVGAKEYSINVPVLNEYEISYRGEDWASLRFYNPDAIGRMWEMRYKLSPLRRSDTNAINSSPTSNISLLVNVPRLSSHVLLIPVSDADGDTVRCR
jgi:hypothetical protein